MATNLRDITLAPANQRGFTLIEMIVVIVITGIIAAAVAVFMRAPVQAYFDTVRRAETTDRVDNALRRIGRDLRLALPNSVRVTTAGANTAIEFLVTSAGGRYRAELTAAAAGDVLDFTSGADSSFDVLGSPVTITLGDHIVVYNLGIPGADAYSGTTQSRRSYPGAGGTLSNIPFTSTGTPFPFSSSDNRFQIIQNSPVAYYCNVGAGQLTRHTGYAIPATQAIPPPGAGDLMMENVTACNFIYDTLPISARTGLVTLTMTVTRNGESINLYHTVHVSNVP